VEAIGVWPRGCLFNIKETDRWQNLLVLAGVIGWLKMKAGCTAWVIETQMTFSMDKSKPCIWKYTVLTSIHLDGLYTV